MFNFSQKNFRKLPLFTMVFLTALLFVGLNSASAALVAGVPSCIDTEGADKTLNYYQWGQLSIFDGANSSIQIDTCTDGRYLNETYCLNNLPKTVRYRCPGACYDGRCITPNELAKIANCTDSERQANKSLNYYQLGTLTYKANSALATLTDTCADGRYLNEAYCLGGEAKTIRYRCPWICEAGVCKAPIIKSCTDSEGPDKSLNYYKLGTLTVKNGTTAPTTTDSCYNEHYLNETYCLGGEAKTIRYRCPGICDSGICKAPPVKSCTDSEGADKSLNYYKFGTVTTYLDNKPSATLSDSCEPGTRYLNETYCLKGESKTFRYRCPGICLKGVCTAPTTTGN